MFVLGAMRELLLENNPVDSFPVLPYLPFGIPKAGIWTQIISEREVE
jgi:hypothetical protein